MAKQEIIAQCRLCLEQKVLVDSHVIPNFHYKSLKKEEGFFYHLSTNPNQPEYRRQKGITEHLFCLDCDTVRLSKNEEHLARIIYGGYPLDGTDDGRFHTVKGFDYTKVKNGLLSILWRMSLSVHPFFKEVELGNKHEERIRKAIWNNETLSESEYPILLTAPIFKNTLFGDFILEPTFAHVGGNRIYRCVISGLLFTFIVGSAEVDKLTKLLVIKSNGSWPIIKATIEEIPFLLDAVNKFGKAQKLRKQI